MVVEKFYVPFFSAQTSVIASYVIIYICGNFLM